MTAPGELIIEPKNGQPADACVFIIHGLGADGHDFEPLVPALALPENAHVRFIMPHAPRLPVTINGGMVMPAWYDILAMDIDRKVDEAGVLASADAVDALIEREIQRGIPAHRIVIAGFSQGGAVAYQAALRYPQKLAGLLTLSTYMAMPVTPSAANASLPVMICHGSQDPMVPEVLGRRAADTLTAMGFAPEYLTYPMEHMVCLEQIRDIGQWLSRVLSD